MAEEETKLPDNKWFRFIPAEDITAKEVADILVALAWAVDYKVYIQLPESTRRNFVEISENELHS